MCLQCKGLPCCPKQPLIFCFLEGQPFSDVNKPVIPCRQESRENSFTLCAVLGVLRARQKVSLKAVWDR